jgi:hypothetical protein
MPQLPSPLRAAIGLAAEAAEQARALPSSLPNKALELPRLAVSTALQLSLRAQQRYAMLAARGEEILNHRETTDEPPEWATFDDPAPSDDMGRPPGPTGRSKFDIVGDD